MSPLLAVEAPHDLAYWVGATILFGALSSWVTRVMSRGDKDATKVELALSELSKTSTELKTEQKLQAKDIASLTATVQAVDKRQDEQARNHRDAMAVLRQESINRKGSE